MIKSYTIGSINSLSLLPTLDRAQFTLNIHMSPDKRKAAQSILKIKNEETELFIHYDFLRTIPRYPLMTEQQQSSMIKEVVSLLRASSQKKNIKGIIIHMDFPFKKELIKTMISTDGTVYSIEDSVKRNVNSVMYRSSEEIVEMIRSLLTENEGEETRRKFLLRWNAHSIDKFYLDLKREIWDNPIENPCKIFIENTSHLELAGGDPMKVPVAGSVRHNALLASSKQDVFGVCWDTEHAFASNDIIINSYESVEALLKVVPSLLVHLNTIEAGVKRGNFKDRHSKTTIFECTEFDKDYYLRLVEMLDKLNVPYVREVKEETMFVELEVQTKLNIK